MKKDQKDRNDLNEYIKKNPPCQMGDYERIAEKFKVPTEIVRSRCRYYGFTLAKTNPDYKSSFQKKGKKKEKVKHSVPDYVEKVISGIDENRVKVLKEIPMPTITCGEGDEEEAVVVLSDWQLGHKTRTFNHDIAKEQIETMLYSVLKMTAIHRAAFPVKKINLFLEGDFVQNEAVGYLVDLSELEGILIDQVFEWAVPLLAYLITELAKNFEEVKIHCVRGNHGRGERMNSEKTNWDDVIYKVLACKFSDNPRVKFNIAREFYTIAEIKGWRYLLTHGDQVRGGSYGIPLYALLQRMLRWATSIPEKWDVLCVGHWHCFGHIEQNSQFLLVNGTLVSNDEYVRKQYGWNASTCQIFFSVHKKRPITGVYLIDFKEKPV